MKCLLVILLFPLLLSAQQTYVPDDNFEKALIDLGYDTPPLNDSIPTKNIDTLTNLNVSSRAIKDLTGIEGFIALTKLMCYRNTLKSFDVSKNTALTYLDCGYSSLTKLDVSKNTALIELNCSVSRLTDLDISKNIALTDLDCSNLQLTSLDVSKNPALKALFCQANYITSLDVSKNPALKALFCQANYLTSLDVGINIALCSLVCHENPLTGLDVSKNTALQFLGCAENQLTSLDVSNNPNMQILVCQTNQLTNLDLSKNPGLKMLWCFDNSLTVLDLSKHTALEQLWCNDNKLTELDLKNGNNKNMKSQYGICFDARNNPQLICIQVDDSSYSINNSFWYKDFTAHYSENCIYTGVDDKLNINNSISFSPNPASDYIEITVGAQRAVPDAVSICDILGSEVLKSMDSRFRGNDSNFSEGNIRIDVSGLSPGVYFVRVGDVVKKFVKI